MSSEGEPQQQPPEDHNQDNQNSKAEQCEGKCMEQENGANQQPPEERNQVNQEAKEGQCQGNHMEHENGGQPERECECGPGYASPMEAFRNGPREKFLFVMCPNVDRSKPDIIVSVDVDPESSTYCKV